MTEAVGETIGDTVLWQGDNLDVLGRLPAASVDAVVTDPPAGIGFMGKTWDSFPTLAAFRQALTATFTKVRPVIKPGGHLLVWALPKTSHHTAIALEEAGFDVKDVICHAFGAGMPKSLDIGKAVDAHLGAERTVPAGVKPGHESFVGRSDPHAAGGRADGWDRPWRDDPDAVAASHQRMAPASPDGEEWDGWGSGLKPAVEFWVLARKPLAAPTIAGNVLAYGTGGLNIDATRVPYQSAADEAGATPAGRATSKPSAAIGAEPDAGRGLGRVEFQRPELKGRWPANLVLSHTPACRPAGQRLVRGDSRVGDEPGTRPAGFGDVGSGSGSARPNGTLPADDLVVEWDCDPGCPVRVLDEQAGRRRSGSGNFIRESSRDGAGNTSAVFGAENRPAGTEMVSYGDEGGVSRYFNVFGYYGKATRADRDEGLDGFAQRPLLWSSGTENPGSFQSAGTVKAARNPHPAVKNRDLMRWLCRLVCPPGGTVLDCYMGSGSTGVACVEEGFAFVGIERDGDYFRIARARVAHAVAKPRQLGLF